MSVRSSLLSLVQTTAIGLFVFVLAAGACISWRQSQVEDAKEWCERVADDVEAWRASHGEYPASLAEAGLGNDPPALCASGLIYGTRPEGGFYLDFSEFLLIGWCYQSSDRTWHRYD